MGIEVNNTRYSKSFIGRFDPSNTKDMQEFEMLKAMVRYFNNSGHAKNPLRVCKRGRKPIEKMMTPRGHYTPGSKRPVSYNYFGNIVGGIENASCFDVYLYKRG